MGELSEEQKSLLEKVNNCLKDLREILKASQATGSDEHHENFLRTTAIVLAGLVAAMTALTAAVIAVIGNNNGTGFRQLLLSAAFGELLVWLVCGIILGTFAVFFVQVLRFFQNQSNAKSIFSFLGGTSLAAILFLGYFIAEAGVCAATAAHLNPKEGEEEIELEVQAPVSQIFYCGNEKIRWAKVLK